MRAVSILLCAATFALITPAAAEDMLKIAIPQRGTWDTSISEIGQNAGIFKKHGLNLDLLFTGAGCRGGGWHHRRLSRPLDRHRYLNGDRRLRQRRAASYLLV